PSKTYQKTEKKLDHWTNDQTNMLVSWLTSHLANCHILFYENKGHHDSNNKPSAKDKTGIHDIIAQCTMQRCQRSLVFALATTSASNLCKVFIKHYGKLNQTGQGVLPSDGAANAIGIVYFTFYLVYLTNYPIELVCKEFPWYNDLL
ncbi:hypothetical protein PAXRUDRAFT_172317, partial [Paxillus rubicundulus Ve08.2h10]